MSYNKLFRQLFFLIVLSVEVAAVLLIGSIPNAACQKHTFSYMLTIKFLSQIECGACLVYNGKFGFWN